MPTGLTKVRFHFLQGSYSLADRSSLKKFLEILFKSEKKALGSLHYIFCSDDYLLAVNRQFLKHDFYTDVISFDLADPGKPVNGEIYISYDRVRENAGLYQSSIKKEVHRVIFHGALHLCGYDDKKEKNALIMRKMEEKYLKAYFG